MQSRALHLFVLLSCLACWSAVMASRVAPEDQLSTRPAQQLQDNPSTAHSSMDKKKKKKGSTDFEDQDSDVRSHWALLVAGSSGWFNYRHQADVFHAYQVLLAGGYHKDHIVVMAADDIAQDSENPMPGKVFNMPGGPNVYDGVRIDYRGADVTAQNFLSVLLGDAAAMAGKGTGRVVDSGPHDKLFVFYSDHGAAGVLGMPTGPFLYADEFIKTLKKKHSKKGFKEAVLYIEACESGSMFEGLLGNDMDIYVTTAANAIESSWATYCPTFYSPAGGDDVITDTLMMTNGDAPAVPAAVPGGWQQWVVRGLGWMQQQLERITGAPQPAAAAVSGGVKPSPQFTTCLGDLYSVAWMEDAESSDLTKETLLQQYKNVKVRTSQNFTYEQGSHVMQYGDLDIDKELAGDYEGMMHNGSTPTPTTPSQDWIDAAAEAAAAAAQQQYTPTPITLSSSRSADAVVNGLNAALQRYSSPAAFLQRVKARSSKGPHSHTSHKSHSHSVEQRDADLVPLAAAAHSSSCPRKRAAAAAALKKATADRLALEGKARTAVSQLLRQPGIGYNAYVMMSNMGWSPSRVLQGVGLSQQQQQQQQVLGEPLLLLSGDAAAAAVGEYVEVLMGPLPGGVAGGALVEDWQCLRNMVQAWEGACGVLDQYGMKLTRLFANLCNVGVQPQQLHTTLTAGPCTAAGRH